MKSQTWKVWIAIATLLTCLMSSELSAQDRKGKRLFEKEWSWNGPAQLNPKAERVVRVTSLAPFPTGGGDGLGPLYNAKSCNACHPGGGASGVEHNVTLITVEPRSEFFMRPSTDVVMEFFPGLLSGVGISFNTAPDTNPSEKDCGRMSPLRLLTTGLFHPHGPSRRLRRLPCKPADSKRSTITSVSAIHLHCSVSV